MQAELHHKISSSGSNLSDQLEDKLTGDVFGALRYLPFSSGLVPILTEGVEWEPGEKDSKAEFMALVEHIENHELHKHLQFWPRESSVEPDLTFETNHFHCWIEVKYNSDLSGEDQLVKQAKAMMKNKSNIPKFLILLARQENLSTLSKGDDFPEQVRFGTLSWQAVYRELKNVKDGQRLEFPYALILDDILKLLKKKGFDPFTGFPAIPEIKTDQVFWHFQSKTSPFGFTSQKTINHEQYFRFEIE